MPAITLAYLAVAVGLLLGFGGAVVSGVLLALAAAVFGAARERPTFVAAAVAGAAALALAAGLAARDGRCLASHHEARMLAVRLEAPAAPGAATRGHLAEPGCGGVTVRARVDRGIAANGALVEIRGTAYARERWLDVPDASVRLVEPPGVLARWRERAGRAIDTLYGRRAPLARALLVADERAIEPAVRDRFADAGIVHMLSVFGLHVAILGEAVALVFALLRLPPRRVNLATVAIVALYVAMIGAPSPAVRSATMLAAVRLSALQQRPLSEWAALALGGAIPLVDPRTVLEVGYQLSVAGMAGLMASGHLARRLPRLEGRTRRVRLARDLLATALTTVVTAPIVAWTFGRLSLAAPATNLLAAPLFGLAQPALFLSLALAPIAPLARLVADGTGLVLDAIDGVASLGAAIPYAVVSVAPEPRTAVFIAVGAAATVVACASRHYARATLVAAIAFGAAVWQPLLPMAGAPVELHVLDVGQGDAVAVRTPHGEWIVVDAGGLSARGDAGERTVAPFLRQHGGRVALLVLTHPHADHVGGAASLITAVGADTVLDAARVFGTASYESTLRAARGRGSVWQRVRPGDTHVVDGVAATVLAPDSVWTATRDDPNTSSVVVRVQYGAVSFLLTGDAEADEEGWLVDRYGEQLRADVLKVAHHGSRTSSTDAFLDAVRPRLALISVGRGNRYGHPDADVLRRFDARSVEVWRTDDDGTITVQTDGRLLWLRARGSLWKLRD